MDLAQAARYDVSFDVMPRPGGIEVVRRLRAARIGRQCSC